MADWTLPVNTSSYLNVLNLLADKDIDAYSMAETPTSPPIGAIRYLRATNTFEEWDGALWNVKVVSIASGGTGANTAASARTNLGLGSMATQNNNAVNITGGTAVFSTLLATDSTFIGALVRVVNAAPNIRFQANTQPLNGKFWNIAVPSNNFIISVLDDAETSGNIALQIVRNATTITNINFKANIYSFKNSTGIELIGFQDDAVAFKNSAANETMFISSIGDHFIQVIPKANPSLQGVAQVGAGTSTLGASITLGNNALSSGAPGTFRLVAKDGTSRYIWIDTTGKLRIGPAAPNTTGNDTIGVVVGTQT